MSSERSRLAIRSSKANSSTVSMTTTQPEEEETVAASSVLRSQSSAERRVNQLSHAISQQHLLTERKYKNVSKYFPSEMKEAVEKHWSAIYPTISGAVKEGYKKLFEELGVKGKLDELDRLSQEHQMDSPAWRPSGDPERDSRDATAAEARTFLPQFEKLYSEAQQLTGELRAILQEKETEILKIEEEINSLLQNLENVK